MNEPLFVMIMSMGWDLLMGNNKDEKRHLRIVQSGPLKSASAVAKCQQ
jgi:hypothetical protein